MADPNAVIHDEKGRRFCVNPHTKGVGVGVKLSGYEACLMYRRAGQELDLYHTYVPEVFRGRGIAERLCKAAFEYAKTHRLTVLPSCSYISGAYLKRHPECEVLTRRGPTSNPLVSG